MYRYVVTNRDSSFRSEGNVTHGGKGKSIWFMHAGEEDVCNSYLPSDFLNYLQEFIMPIYCGSEIFLMGNTIFFKGEYSNSTSHMLYEYHWVEE